MASYDVVHTKAESFYPVYQRKAELRQNSMKT